MAGEPRRTDSNTEILQELQRLSESLCRDGTSRRTASLVLPRSSNANPASVDGPQVVHEDAAARRDRRSRSSRALSLSPWRLRPRPQREPEGDDSDEGPHNRRSHSRAERRGSREAEPVEKKGIWSWKPMRALAHIAMHRLACLFSVEVLTVEHLPASMNGLRLAVAFRKKETRDGAMQTMPSRVLDGSADFEETLYIRCHLYCTGGAGTAKPLKFEPRPFVIFAFAADAPELDFGKHTIDLSSLIRESIDKNFEGQRVRQWHKVFQLSGKAKGGEMVLKLAFQMMTDGGIGIYNQSEAMGAVNKGKSAVLTSRNRPGSPLSVFSARTTRSEPTAATDSNGSPERDMKGIDALISHDDSCSSLSSTPSVQKSKQEPPDVFSARTTRSEPTAATDSNGSPERDVKGIDVLFSHDEVGSSLSSPPSVQRSIQEPMSAFSMTTSEPERDRKRIDVLFSHDAGSSLSSPSSAQKSKKEPDHDQDEDLDLPEFEVIDRGVEYEEQEERDEDIPKEAAERATTSCEVVKEVVHDRLKELDSIAREIKTIEQMMRGEGTNAVKATQDHRQQTLEAEEELVTRGFLQLLELEKGKRSCHEVVEHLTSPSKLSEDDDYEESNEERAFLSDLGKGVGLVVQTSDGGYLISMNPFNVQVARKETPKITMQISRAVILQDRKAASGFEMFQRFAATGPDELSCQLLSLMAMDELMDKTPEQIAFEGVAAAVINGRNKEGASSSAARSVAVVKKMGVAMIKGRRERILTGIWNAHQQPVTIDKILNYSLQRMEAVAIDALKVQSDIGEDQEVTFAVSPLIEKDDSNSPLESILAPEDWVKTCGKDSKATMLIVIQLRDPLRSYEAVGAPMIALMQVIASDDGQPDEGWKFKPTSLHIGGFRLRPGVKRSVWDGEKQRLTATQWLVANGLARTGARTKKLQTKRAQDMVWSISTRVMADMWLKPTRNPNFKVPGNNR